ncbi:DUF6680 family protein [Rhizorhapis suberifaciens]|uniref:DUF6680 domain-containing protein n=1 Tax=Rhizorhapis suberifaciens TaxID=13656 RepID=A0A840HQQ5_9SPHN|nr:DUF6680 family protein [Rhizorhapis suberifaciens]MBB4640041.1 hypothetical protein [Rhizorhapis suberifaciens]
MTTNEIINLSAILAGPIFAVVITLWWQHRQRKHEMRFKLAQTIWDTHHDSTQAEFSAAIRAIPIIFNKDAKVRSAWKGFMGNVNQKPSTGNEGSHEQDFVDRKHDLILALSNAVDLNVTEREIRDSVYVASAYTDMSNLMKRSYEAQVRIAEALENNNRLIEQSLHNSSNRQGQ